MFDLPSDQVIRLLEFWIRYGSREQVMSYVAHALVEDPRNALRYIKLHLKAYDMNTGLPIVSGLSQDHYNSIVRYIGEDDVYNALEKICGTSFESPQYEITGEKPLDERIAHQFAFLYQRNKLSK